MFRLRGFGVFDVKLDRQAARFLKKCEKLLFERIRQKLELLKQNPIPQDAKRIVGCEQPTFRIRIGKYRALYRINYETKTVVIVLIDKRSRVYDRGLD